MAPITRFRQACSIHTHSSILSSELSSAVETDKTKPDEGGKLDFWVGIRVNRFKSERSSQKLAYITDIMWCCILTWICGFRVFQSHLPSKKIILFSDQLTSIFPFDFHSRGGESNYYYYWLWIYETHICVLKQQWKKCSSLRRLLPHSLLYPQFTYMIFIYLQPFTHHFIGLFGTNIMTSSLLAC